MHAKKTLGEIKMLQQYSVRDGFKLFSVGILTLLMGFAAPAHAAFVVDIFEANTRISTWEQAFAAIDDSPDYTEVVSLVDFYDEAVVERGIFAGYRTFPGGVDDNFVMRARATFRLQETSVMTFALAADDGTSLSIDGVNLFTDIQPLHWLTMVGGTTTLDAGTHTLELIFFDREENAEVELFYLMGQPWFEFAPETGAEPGVFFSSSGRKRVARTFTLLGAGNNNGLALVAVPIPAAAWLLASGLASLYWRRRVI